VNRVRWQRHNGHGGRVMAQRSTLQDTINVSGRVYLSHDSLTSADLLSIYGECDDNQFRVTV
jgi:hypothetical protein